MLISVLTNSFMAIVQNANQEHQFLFAVNTISMVKSDALFSYVAPTNLLAWVITPLRYLMPFRQFIKINRMTIKITHFPILFIICLYEKTILSSKVVQPTDLIETPAHPETPTNALNTEGQFPVFSSNTRRLVREPSIATYQKDRALDEVFRQPLDGSTTRRPRDGQRPLSSNIVKTWMRDIASGSVHPPDDNDSDEVDRLEGLPSRLQFSNRRSTRLRNLTETSYSVASDPEDGRVGSSTTPRKRKLSIRRASPHSRHTGAEGDDELTSDNENSTDGKGSVAERSIGSAKLAQPSRLTPKHYSSRPSTARRLSRRDSPSRRPKMHSRTVSNTTMLYNPVEAVDDTPSPAGKESTRSDDHSPRRHSLDGDHTGQTTSISDPRSVPELGGFNIFDTHTRRRRRPSILFDLGSDLGDNKAIPNSGLAGPAPSSFTTQMAYATGGIRRGDRNSGDQDMLSKLVLARMNNIEEGFREVIKEVKDLRREGQGPSRAPSRSRLRGQTKRRRETDDD